MPLKSSREIFASKFGVLATMIGAAVGLGNIMRFPYMVGKFGGSAFVLFYLFMVLFVGVPALIAEWILGRHTRKGTLGAFEKGGFPGGKYVGMFFFGVVFFSAAYYTNTVGWVAYFTLAELFNGLDISMAAEAILPPESGFNYTSIYLQAGMSAAVIILCGIITAKGLRKGVEKLSKLILPLLTVILLFLLIYSFTLSGFKDGLQWYIFGFRFEELTASVMAAAMGQAFFSLSLGGQFMVIYGSYLSDKTKIMKTAYLTAMGDTVVGLAAGLIIFPLVFTIGLPPNTGPELLFVTLPKAFAGLPAGWIPGFLFFGALFGAAFLSDVAAVEVLVGGVVDNTSLTRKKASIIVTILIFVLAVIPMINMNIFVKWDLTFGSGMQVAGSLFAVLTTSWCIKRSNFLKEIGGRESSFGIKLLYWWLRVVIPIAILIIGLNWIVESI